MCEIIVESREISVEQHTNFGYISFSRDSAFFAEMDTSMWSG